MRQRALLCLFFLISALFVSSCVGGKSSKSGSKGGSKSGGSSGTGRYEVVKNKLVGPTGAQFLIRGVNRPSLEWRPDGEALTQSELTLMKGWGFNAVRLPLNQAFWLSDRAAYNANYRTVIHQYVDWATAIGFVVVLDLHWSDQGNAQASQQCPTSNGDPNCYGQQPLPDSGSITFWQQAAVEYAAYGNVLFELYNEPFQYGGYTPSFTANPWTIWRNGGYISRQITGTGYQAVGLQQLVDAIRATGATNVLIANGLDYGYDLTGVAGVKLTGSNIMYGLHPYDNKMTTLPLSRNIGSLMKTYPIIATEFGQKDCNGVATYKAWLDYAKSNKLHWMAWAWYGPASTLCTFPPLLLNSVQTNDGLPDPIRGAYVKAAIAAGF